MLPLPTITFYDLSQTGVVTAGAQALVNGINIIGGGATATPCK